MVAVATNWDELLHIDQQTAHQPDKNVSPSAYCGLDRTVTRTVTFYWVIPYHPVPTSLRVFLFLISHNFFIPFFLLHLPI